MRGIREVLPRRYRLAKPQWMPARVVPLDTGTATTAGASRSSS